MICGNFRESIGKEISLNDIDAERLLKLLQVACGTNGLVAEDIQELLELGELADHLQMEAVRSEVEDRLSKELRVENCLEMIQRSGLELLHKMCCNMLRGEFEIISQKEGFLKLSEETMGALLEEDELGASREEDVFEAVVRWISSSDEGMRGMGLLRKIRYGLMSNEYLAGLLASESLPGHGMVKELVGEASAKMGGEGDSGMWDGVERLCGKWMVVRGLKGRIIGADVLKGPAYLAIDGEGRIVVSDGMLDEVIIFNLDGTFARRFGSTGTAAGQFGMPSGVAVDRQGHIIVADCRNHRIQVLNADGSAARIFGSNGTAPGQLSWPRGLTIDREGHIVVADHENHRIQVFDADGSVVCHFGSRGAAIGQLQNPVDVAVDGAGRIVVADWGNHRVQVFNCDGSVALCFGSQGDGPGQFNDPHGVAVDSAGRFIVSDTSNHRIHLFNPDGTVACVMGSSGDGIGELRYPHGVVVAAGRILVVEGRHWSHSKCNHRVQVL